MDNETRDIISKTADETAKKTLALLKNAGKIKYYKGNTFNRVKELLFLYNNLPADSPTRQRINDALETLSENDYADVIKSYYFDGMTIAEIAEIYDCADRTIAKKRNQLIKALARILFPEEMAKEIIERN